MLRPAVILRCGGEQRGVVRVGGNGIFNERIQLLDRVQPPKRIHGAGEITARCLVGERQQFLLVEFQGVPPKAALSELVTLRAKGFGGLSHGAKKREDDDKADPDQQFHNVEYDT